MKDTIKKKKKQNIGFSYGWMKPSLTYKDFNFSSPQHSQNNLDTFKTISISPPCYVITTLSARESVDGGSNVPTWMRSVYYANVYMCVHCTYIHVCITHITYVFHTCILVYVCIPARWKHAVCDQMHQMDQKAGSTARHQTPGQKHSFQK